MFADENLDLLSHVLDDWFRVPGTSIRFGLDGIIGLVPGLGDIIGGLASTIIVFAAWVRGVPYITLVRMVVNIGIEVVLGTVPILGDMFDIAWKANRRNYALITRHLQQSRGKPGETGSFCWSLALLWPPSSWPQSSSSFGSWNGSATMPDASWLRYNRAIGA